MSCLSRFSIRLPLAALAAWLWMAGCLAVAALNSQEQALADRVIGASSQGRAFVTIDATLSAVARAKAADMANREYFAHTDPDGNGANTLVRRAGYSLPSHYSTAASGNNIESLAAGYSSVSSVWTGWMASADHKRHILGETDFFAEQTSLGVGYYEKSGSPYRYYWVILTAPPTGPRLSITTPAANATLTSGNVAVTGTTSGGPAAERVEVRVENGNGSGSYVVASGRTTWSATVGGLVGGQNTLRVRSIGADGSVLKEATRVVRRLVMEELTVAIDGNGYVSKGYAGVTPREVGREYVLSAAPFDGWLFSHWSGGESSTSAKLTFTMRAGLELTANFIPNPFLAHAGSYNGLLFADDVEHATSGFVKVSVATSGVVTGKLLLGGVSHAFTTRLNLDGDATITIPRTGHSSLTLRLDLDVDGDSDQISGTLSDGEFTASFVTDLAGSASEYAGRYTVSLPPSGEFATPGGAGWAVVSVSRSGVASLSGRLADGATISAAATVSRDGEVPIYRVLYSALGSVSGTFRFRATASTDLDGSFYWHKPQQSSAARYAGAFSVESPIVGSRYSAPASGQRVITLDAAVGNAVVTLRDGGLAASIAQAVTVTGVNLVKPVAPVAREFSAAIKTASGAFSGVFTDPETNVVRRFEGVFLQKQNAGSGYFLGAESSGRASFVPAE
jgi:Divergent InlB B-repeat domain/Cysteine-rich secretory protein family/Bacterial Ig domain